ncbi:MAG: protein kinase [Elusimicrobia bacterium]|nr:protein kinase [Elusimicrobiota bacterium]
MFENAIGGGRNLGSIDQLTHSFSLAAQSAAQLTGQSGQSGAAGNRYSPESNIPPEVKSQASAYGQVIETQIPQLSGPASVNASAQAGDYFLFAGRPEDAARNYRRALAAQPDNVAALQGLAQSLYQQGRVEEARAEAQKVLAVDPENKVAGLMAGPSAGVKSAQGVADKFKRLTQGFLHGPSEEEPLGGSAGAAGAMPGVSLPGATAPGSRLTPQQVADQAQAWAPAREPTHFAPLVEKALSKRELGDYTGALLALSQSLDADPNDPSAWTVRAEVDNQLKNYPAAVTDAGRALDLKPGALLAARALRARIYAELESGQVQQALADAARAIELDPRNGLGFLYRAMAEERLGLADASARDLQSALSLDPSLRPLAEALAGKLGLSATAPRAVRPSSKRLVRGGIIALSLLLVLVGLMGTQRGRALTRRLTTRPRAAASAEGAPAASGPELQEGSLLGNNYRIVRELGRGGMGVVYEGFDQALQRRVAIKRLQSGEQTLADDRERFLREARLVARLKHPHVAEIHTVLDDGELYLIFEYIEGRSLDQVLALDRALPIAAVRRLVGEMASALSAAHAQGIIHRDLKPGNVMIGADGGAKVMDFGIAHQSRAAAALTQTMAAGTPPYMAPEQGLGSVSKASDLYALAVMAYELLCGSRPFAGPDYLDAKLQRRYEPVTSRLQSLPPALDGFFARALDPDPTRRHRDAAAFAAEFASACAGAAAARPA